VDTAGLVLAVVITAASVQDRDGARPLLWNMARCCTRIRLAWADAGYTGNKLATWAASVKITLEIVRKRDAHAFEILPRRWVVERTLAWITSCCRCARDYQRLASQAPRPD
jgi:transposase